MINRERIPKLEKLYQEGKLSKKLKTAVKQLIVAMKKGQNDKIDKISWLHQEISSGYGMKEYPYNEDDEYNMKVAGTTAYREFDSIWHGY